MRYMISLKSSSKMQVFSLVISVVLTLMAVTDAWAVEYFLRADVTTVTMSDGRNVTMWGFALDPDFATESGTVMVPGPVLTVPPGDSSLVIHMNNNLTTGNIGFTGVPVSVVIPGQITAMTPQRFWGGHAHYPGRIRNQTHDTPPGNVTPVDYVWTNLKPGTYMYHSGSHMALQVQMGLYGCMKKDEASGEAYPDVFYDDDLILFYSEVDADFHDTVAAGDFGPTGTVTSTIDYIPRYFLVNGDPCGVILSGDQGDDLLIRFLNAGLNTHVPVLQGLHMRVIAENGNAYPYERQQYSLVMPALNTKDTIINATRIQLISATCE